MIGDPDVIADANGLGRIQPLPGIPGDDRVKIARRHADAGRNGAIRPDLDRLRLDGIEMDKTGEAVPVADAQDRAGADIDVGHREPDVLADIEPAVGLDDDVHVLVGHAASAYADVVVVAVDVDLSGLAVLIPRIDVDDIILPFVENIQRHNLLCGIDECPWARRGRRPGADGRTSNPWKNVRLLT